nr:MAG TPA: hypothetical protein [Caudoviricetes sp.]
MSSCILGWSDFVISHYLLRSLYSSQPPIYFVFFKEQSTRCVGYNNPLCHQANHQTIVM